MTTPSEITPADIGRTVRYTSIANEVTKIDKASRMDRRERFIVEKPCKPVRGMLLGRSIRMAGIQKWDGERGYVFKPYEINAVAVAMIMPLDGKNRYRQPVAVLEWEYEADNE